MNIWQFILRFIGKCKFWFITATLFAMFPSFISAYAMSLYADIIAFIGTSPKEALSSPVLHKLLILAGLYIAQDIVGGLRIYFDARMKILYQRIIHNELFRHNHKHSANFFNTEQSGAILAKTQNLTMGIFSLFGDLRAKFFPDAAFFIASIAMLLNINLKLGAILLLINVAATILIYKNYTRLKTYSQTSAREKSKAVGILTDSIANARIVKFAASFFHEALTLRHQLNTAVRAAIIQGKAGGITNFTSTSFFTLAMVLSLSAILYFYISASLSLADIILSASLVTRLSRHMFGIAEFFENMQTRIGTVNDALELLYRPFDITDAKNAKKLQITSTAIEFKNASFSYRKDKPLFQKLNLSIAPNEKIGLVGASGSGKSTLINLILRAFDLNSGKILISGQDISKVTQYSLHQNIALISQEPCLFNRSIKENIRFARPKATDEEIIKAAKLAHIHDTIIKMPSGYDSIVGERGVKLSGGERQRIAIAAAILKDAPILILDEATSALDSQSEAAIEKALKNIMKNKTVIAIAHRLSTLKNMDRLIVLDNGKIIEQGARTELLKNKNGTFSKLYKLQSDGYLKS